MHDGTVARLTVLSAVLAVGEFISAVIISVESYRDSFAAGAVLFGLLFLVGAWLLRSGRVTAGAVLVGLLCVFEVASFPTFQRHNALDWVFQVVYALVALVALVTSVAVLVARRRSHGGLEGRSQSGTAA
jgi:hypothetical protein